MTFNYQKIPGKQYLKITYSDDLLDDIFKRKDLLKIDVNRELDTLRELERSLHDEKIKTQSELNSIIDINSVDYANKEEELFEIESKIDSLNDSIEYLEELDNNL